MGTAGKILALVVVAVLLYWGALKLYHRNSTTVEKYDQETKVRVDTVRITDSVFRTVMKEVPVVRKEYRTFRDTFNIHDTLQVRELIRKTDSVIVIDSVALDAANKTIVARDKLIKHLEEGKPDPRLRVSVEGLYDPFRQSATVRVGPQLRTFWSIYLKVEGEFDQGHGYAGRVGFKKEF